MKNTIKIISKTPEVFEKLYNLIETLDEKIYDQIDKIELSSDNLIFCTLMDKFRDGDSIYIPKGFRGYTHFNNMIMVNCGDIIFKIVGESINAKFNLFIIRKNKHEKEDEIDYLKTS